MIDGELYMSENPCINNVPRVYCCLNGGLGANRLGRERGDDYWRRILVHGVMREGYESAIAPF